MFDMASKMPVNRKATVLVREEIAERIGWSASGMGYDHGVWQQSRPSQMVGLPMVG